MKTFSEFLNVDEGKQVGVLYHFTTPDAILKIMSKQETSLGLCDILGFASHNGYISTTRDYAEVNDPFGHFTNKTHNNRIAFDGDKLSNKYKIKPINGLIQNGVDIFGTHLNPLRVKSKSEKEEVICPYKNQKIYNLKDYVLQIMINNQDNDKSLKLKNVIQKIIDDEKLNIEVVISRKWLPFKESYASFDECKGFKIEE